MNAPRRILDPRGDAPAVARDLVSIARLDAPPDGAFARSLARLETSVGADGVTTHISALSEAMAAGMLAVPSLTSSPLAQPRVSSATGRIRSVLYACVAATTILVAGGVTVATLLRGRSSVPAAVARVRDVAPTVATASATPAASAHPSAITQSTPIADATVSTALSPPPPSTGVASASTAPRGTHASGGAPRSTAGGVRASTGASASGATVASSGGGGGSSCTARCHGDINCLLNCGTAGGGSSGGGGGGGGARVPSGPEAPARADIASAFARLRSDVNQCGGAMRGTAWVNVTFASSGRITTANVEAPLAGTAAGSCIARTVRRASVPPFTRPTFSVRFPFAIR